MLESSSKVAMAPDGNGGIYAALHKSGAIENMKSNGIQCIYTGAIDNAVSKVGDPVFIGYCLSKNADVGNKVCTKCGPHEKVGIQVLRDGIPAVVEYVVSWFYSFSIQKHHNSNHIRTGTVIWIQKLRSFGILTVVLCSVLEMFVCITTRSIFSQRRVIRPNFRQSIMWPERKFRTWCSSAKRENVSFLIHLLRGLTRVSLFLFTYSEDSLVSRTQPISITRVTLLYPSLATKPLECYGNT